jgi:hypothetical protein
LGYTGATMIITKRSNNVNWSKSFKNYLSSNCSLKLENMKLESLVIVNQNVTVNLSPNLVHTARQIMEIGSLKNCKLFFNIFYELTSNFFLKLDQVLGLSRNRVIVGEPVVG